MGLLITIEGGEFVGKTSVALPGLHKILEDCGLRVLSSREPGGTPAGEKIREEIFQKAARGASADEMALLFNKARRIHLDTVIKPFLGEKKEKDAIVLLDRYLDSTRVYQGLESALGLETVYRYEREFVEGYLPDLTFVLFFPEEIIDKMIAVRRKLAAEESGTRANTSWDEVSIDEHRMRQQRYLSLAAIAKDRGEQRQFRHIDASRQPLAVITDMAKHTRDAILSSGMALPPGFGARFQSALSGLGASPLYTHLERQWKRQQHLLRVI